MTVELLLPDWVKMATGSQNITVATLAENRRKVKSLKLNINHKVDLGAVTFAPKSPLDTSSFEQRLKYLYRVVTGIPYYDAQNSGINKLLDAGCQIFHCEYALLVRSLSSLVCEVMVCQEPDLDETAFYPGQHLSVEVAPFSKVVTQNQIAVVNGLAVAMDTPQCGGVNVERYLAIPVKPQSAAGLYVCFFTSELTPYIFNQHDLETLELISEGVASMIDLQRAQLQRKPSDSSVLTMSSVNSLDEYVQQARMPDVFGMPAKVLEILKHRVGHESLNIEAIAEDLNLSKRTLQRRLQQQGISFAELRDQVRFHFAIDYLVKQNISIDQVSISLDFSDRTSFTNAFKRWTSLSPSTFRRLFRDFV